MTYSRQCDTCGDTKPLVRFPRKGKGRTATCTDCQTAARRRARTPATRRVARDARLRREYGITLADYERMGRVQQWRCAICDRKAYPAGSRLVVDHDHASGYVRGLLCSPCNSALGLMGDKPDRLYAAARYLSHHADLRTQVSP